LPSQPLPILAKRLHLMWRRKSGQIFGYNWLFVEREARWVSNWIGER
jgi:hypothetical protein